MEKPFEIQESPSKPNVTYIVKCMQKDADHELYFEWLVNFNVEKNDKIDSIECFIQYLDRYLQ